MLKYNPNTHFFLTTKVVTVQNFLQDFLTVSKDDG